MTLPVLYEHPLNERVRTFLRLEHFFAQAYHFRLGTSSHETEATVSALIDIVSQLERYDVRSEAVKELERLIQALSRLLDTPGVDKKKLDNALEKLNTQVQGLRQHPNKVAPNIRDNELFTLIRHRCAISAGTCGFDLPAYHYWLNQPRTTRHERLLTWLAELNPLKESIDLILSLIRNSGVFEPQIAEGGFYQKTLESQNAYLLLRLTLQPQSESYPEISGNKRMVNIRFLGFNESNRAKQIAQDLPFEISLCGL